jgi:quercetin dioxygenase-like cupin family protein
MITTPNPTNLHRWSDIPREKMTDLVARQVLHADTMTVARLELRQSAVVPMHSHLNEQIAMVTAGALRFEIGGAEVIVRAGEMLQIPGGVPHSVVALEDSVAVDVFSPVREDWVRGDDAYLRGR